MKKIFSFLILTIISFSLNAQNRKSNPINLSEYQTVRFRSSSDTLIPSSFIDSSSGGMGCQSVVYTVDINSPIDSGYVTGTNIYNDLEKGQRYYISEFGYQNITVGSVIAHFGIIHPNDTSGFVFAKIYNLNSNGFPDSLLASSDSINISDLVFSINGIAEFIFSNPLNISSSIIACIDFSNCLQDTVALVHTEQNCFDTTGGAWEKWNDSTWHSLNNSWQFETDLAIFPVVSNGVLLPAEIISKENQLSIFPNPSGNFVNINSIKPFTTISIYDVAGRKIIEYVSDKTNSYRFDLSKYSNGIYYIKLNGREIEFVKMIVVQH